VCGLLGAVSATMRLAASVSERAPFGRKCVEAIISRERKRAGADRLTCVSGWRRD